ncbi:MULTISPECIES: hypothetical protein [Methylosinus]|uniref:Uncharacterized protein n=1 Tax=Methylosinus trichosporium (strain ATCC 35070 / NCIMB 11131 / UNIQEM 75 / OB3b) TaxID=595536 RepID=A0A2D2CXB6_METT3|nr:MULTISPECIES: hypothetical protein [Methylosinus]ATQ67343.1 hypothetical protein CQW49_05135 [Methylosinus trichosporium OB3b]OBS51642.1 hypothetical protein A8B73_15640 [Methylosinus sp. 3S-1]
MADSLKDAFTAAKSAFLPLTMLAAVVSAGVFVCNNPDVVGTLLARVQTVELGDLKIALGEQAFKINSALQAKHLTADAQAKLAKLAADLGPREVDRLLHLPEVEQASQGDRYLHCEFERSTAQMRYFTAVDHGLAERALVKIAPRADLATKTPPTPSLGRALTCYQMELTDDGYDVKSLIVSEMTRFFHGGFEGEFEKGAPREGAKSAAAERPREKAARAGKGERVAAR